MSAKELRARPAGELRAELLKLRKEQFALRMQRATGQGAKPSEFGRVRKTIARLKTVMREQQIGAAKAPKPAGGK
jgi:large subunit ribosomal protein L29